MLESSLRILNLLRNFTSQLAGQHINTVAAELENSAPLIRKPTTGRDPQPVPPISLSHNLTH